ncbi:PAS domain S-box protein [Mucilaginibacter conchicola]|uniref:histidine kinase n=1 Tax=Mucilaginibacter conchicola TaxID=2303333 RepID=A0A372NYH1_9SPHI|nr:PAS domain-containing protein [Mucilaginibacter conchicola]RFZ95166.1 PAS domain S-box protein [Mucilaginibacter conchicola]
MSLQIKKDDATFKALFHHNPYPMWIVEIDTLLFKEVNEAAIKHYGYSRDEFLNEITLANIRPFYEQQEMLDLIRRIKHNQTITTELTHILKDGSIIFVNITSFTVDYYGAHCRMVIIHDITEQRLKDLKLTEAVDRINKTLESITDGFITMDKHFRVTYWNKEAARILAITREDILNKQLWEVDTRYHEMELYKQLHKALQSMQTNKFEQYIPQLHKWVCFTIYPGKDGLAVYFQDITAQKRGEEELNEKNESLNQIAYINSHLIRKPLANILGIINSMEGIAHNDYMEESLKMLRRSAVELDNIIKDINNRVERSNRL